MLLASSQARCGRHIHVHYDGLVPSCVQTRWVHIPHLVLVVVSALAPPSAHRRLERPGQLLCVIYSNSPIWSVPAPLGVSREQSHAWLSARASFTPNVPCLAPGCFTHLQSGLGSAGFWLLLGVRGTVEGCADVQRLWKPQDISA